MRERFLPYGRQHIDDEDISAVVAALRSDWLTTGPRVEEFERAFAETVGAGDAVAVSSGTAALHAAMFAIGIGPGDEVIVPAMTFAASANCVAFLGGTPVFADVDPETLLLDPESAAARITPRTKAIVAVDYAGQPCAYDALGRLADAKGLTLVADGCHALGGRYHGRPVGTLAALTAFSFHPVKHVTTGEGGMVSTDRPELARRMRAFRNHGLSNDGRQREKEGGWFYEMRDLGFNYRLTDFQCALGKSQLGRLPGWVRRRQELARVYDAAFARESGIRPLATAPGVEHARHLYVVRVDADRAGVFKDLRADGIGVNVHYIPVHLHPYYRRQFGTGPGLCPVAESAYERILSLPMFPQMTDADAEGVIRSLRKAVEARRAPVASGG
jgi:perosamine synthetase